MTQFLARVLATLALVLVGVGSAPAPAGAAYCSAQGVHVAVDFGSLGGGVRTGCHPTDGRAYGDSVVEGAGFSLSWTMDFPDVVCRVNGAPADSSCKSMPPGNAYWGIFEAHGNGWKYSQVGIRGVRLDPGDSVALVWQDGGGTRSPSVAPGVVAKPSPTPTPKPTRSPAPSPKPTRAPSPSQPAPAPGQDDSPTPSPRPSESASSEPDEAAPEAGTRPRKRDRDGQVEEGTAPGPAGESRGDSPATSDQDASGGEADEATDEERLPTAVTWGVLALLGTAVVASAVARRRRAG